LPFSYGSSGIKLKFGMANASTATMHPVARFVVSAMRGGRGLVLAYVRRLLVALESYYQPANLSQASDVLHVFVHTLCLYFVRRVHMERHNRKWPCKTPEEFRLTDGDVGEFVMAVKPIAFHVLYSSFDDQDRKIVFNALATLRPDLIIPGEPEWEASKLKAPFIDLLGRFRMASETLTEPHRYTATVAGLYAVARPLVQHSKEDVVNVLMTTLPGIDVNDIWKCSDIFILISDLLEVMWLVDLSASGEPLMAKTALFEEFVATFTEKCLTLIEHSSREQTRHEADVGDEAMNDEEMAVDAAIGDTFQKMMTRVSPELFSLVFGKVKRFVEARIFEAAVAGNILSSMVKVAASVKPREALDFFIPHFTRRIHSALVDRVDPKKVIKISKQNFFTSSSRWIWS